MSRVKKMLMLKKGPAKLKEGLTILTLSSTRSKFVIILEMFKI
jgi:hypothetical protein